MFIYRNDDGVVLHEGDDLGITADGITRGGRVFDITAREGEATLAEGTPPAALIPRQWAFVGGEFVLAPSLVAAGWELSEDGDPISPPAPPPVVENRQIGIVAQARARIDADSWSVYGFNSNSGLAGVSVWEEGILICEFTNAQSDGDYMVTPTVGGGTHRCYVNPDEQMAEGFLLYTQALDGTPSFPDSVQILVTR